MRMRWGPIGVIAYLLTRHTGCTMIAAGFALVLWSLMSINISHGMPPHHRYSLLLIELAVIAMPAGVVFVAVGACWQLAVYAKRQRQDSLPSDAP